MANGNKLHITLNAGTGNLEMTQDPAGVNNIEIIPKAHIIGIFPMRPIPKPAPPDDKYWIHNFDVMTFVNVCFRRDGIENRICMELQDVLNQPTWSTGTQAGINQCVADFAAFV